MKKFLIMFVMLLGSVTTMQAQTFDFSCEGDSEDSQVDADQAPLFVAQEVIDLGTAGFSEGSQFIDNARVADVNNYSITIDPAVGHNPGQFVLITIDVEDSDPNSGSNVYTIRRSDRPDLTATAANFAAAFVIAQGFVSATTPGFTIAETMMLSEATVSYTSGNGQAEESFTLQTSGAYQISLELGGNTVNLDIFAYNGQYRFSEDGSRISTHATAQEAMDALILYIQNY